jgi:DNA polymerase III subunit epsilon
MLIGLVFVFVAAVLFTVKATQSRRRDQTTPMQITSFAPSGPTQPAAPSGPRDLSTLLPDCFVVVDLETTGLSPAMDEIIEIGAVKVTLGAHEHPCFQTLVRPARPIPRLITQLTGINQAMADRDGIELDSALRQFLEFVGDLPLVAYNAPFDMGFLWAAAGRCRVDLPNRYTCALKRARRAWPELPSHKLSHVAEALQLPDANQHRAVGDCERTVHVFLLATGVLNQKVNWSAPSISE